MKPLDCAAAEEMFSDHYDGTLPPEERAALEAHLATCPTCRALRDVFGEVVDALHRVRDRPLPMRPDLHLRAAATSFVAPPAPAPAPPPRVRARELPVGLQLAAAALGVLLTLLVLAATGTFGSEGTPGRIHARTVNASVYLLERKARVAEDWRLLRIVIGTTLEGRLDLVQERVDAYRRLLEKQRAQPAPGAEPSPSPSPSPARPDGITKSNSTDKGLVPSDERHGRRPRASAEQGARS